MLYMKAHHANYILITFFFLIIGTASGNGQNPVKIMPIGNSITKGETDGSITDDNLLKGYRYDLKQLLQSDGFNTDFVGSESAGCTYFTDCQHAAIGGTRDQFVVRLLTDGYDERNGVQILVPPRPYLDEYNPDIILLHIGTNDITHEADAITNQQVSAILNMIDQYETRANKEVIVFLALIINRKLPDYAGSGIGTTSDFNNAIKKMALARIAAGDKIIIVDMEHDAGFHYDDTDMSDNLHPNANGYLKMAKLWSSSIVNFYNKPENGNFLLYPIPAQDYLIIEFDSYFHEEFRAEVINTSGLMIMTCMLHGNQNNYQLSLRDLENGVYFLHLMNMNINLYKRFSIFK